MNAWEKLLELIEYAGETKEDILALSSRPNYDYDCWDDYDECDKKMKEVLYLTDLREIEDFLRGYKHGGYGLPKVPPTYVWTKNSIYIIGVYDGATWWERIPRNPTPNVTPEFVGGY